MTENHKNKKTKKKTTVFPAQDSNKTGVLRWTYEPFINSMVVVML